MADLRAALQLENSGVISFIGAGGKTSLMFSLAEELVAAGKHVLTTTTTKIFIPTGKDSPPTIVSRCSEQILKQAESFLRNSSLLTLGAEYLHAEGKLRGVEPITLRQIAQSKLFDFILIEADGASHRPLKASASHEPVIPDISDKVVVLAGLDGIGRALIEKWVFRSKLFSEITDLPLNSPVTESHVASILLHELASIPHEIDGTMKIVFLNKADTPEALNAGKRVAGCLAKKGQGLCDRVVIGQLHPEPVIHHCNTVHNRCSK